VLVDVPNAFMLTDEASADDGDGARGLESALADAAGVLEDARSSGLVGNYGFATSRCDGAVALWRTALQLGFVSL
jgi:hypothetical protein